MLHTARGGRLAQRPPVNSAPPQQAQPFVQAGFGPLPMLPPPGSELGIIVGRGGGEGLPANLMAENAEGAAGVEIGSDDQNPVTLFVGQAFFGVAGFIPR